jgi:hypothetical protein
MELRDYIERWSQDEEIPIRERIEKGRTHLFDFDYPIDKDYKKIFETHFIRKFYMREIGAETEGLFKFNLETWLSINMPYFNKLLESELMTFDPFSNTKLDVKQTKKVDKTQTSTTDSKGSNTSTGSQDVSGSVKEDDFARHLESKTPDSRLAITANDGKGVIEYADNIQENKNNNSRTSSTETSATSKDTSDVSASGKGQINEIEDYIESKLGKVGTQTFSSMLKEYRQSFLRIENEIFNEMQELFMLVY